VKINDQPIRQFLAWMIPIRPEAVSAKAAEAAQQGEATDRELIMNLSPNAIPVATRAWERSYDETFALEESISSRARDLLLVVAVLGGIGSLVVPAATGAPAWAAAALFVVAILLAYFALGTAALALRAQRVKQVRVAGLGPEEATTEHTAATAYAASLFRATNQNREQIKTSSGYLRDAQLYAEVSVTLLAVLVIGGVLVNILKPNGDGGSTAGSPRPSSAPSPIAPPSRLNVTGAPGSVSVTPRAAGATPGVRTSP
jgi:hypothetical protein